MNFSIFSWESRAQLAHYSDHEEFQACTTDWAVAWSEKEGFVVFHKCVGINPYDDVRDKVWRSCLYYEGVPKCGCGHNIPSDVLTTYKLLKL